MSEPKYYADVFKHILSGGSGVFPYSSTDNSYDFANLATVKLKAGGVEHPVSTLNIKAKEGASERWTQTWVKAVVRSMLNSVGLQFFSVGANGGVSSDAQMTYITFEAPPDKFDTSALLLLTIGGAIRSMITTLEASPLSEWDNWAKWFGEDRVQMLNSVLVQFDAMRIGNVEVSVPTIPTDNSITDFTSLGGWVIGMLGTFASAPASAFWDAETTKFIIPFTFTKKASYPIEIKDDYLTFTVSSSDWADVTFPDALFAAGTSFTPVSYNTFSGLFSHSVLQIYKTLCPTFDDNYGASSQYAGLSLDGIMYVFVETSVPALGATIQPGWYAISTSTYAFVSYDIANNPIIVSLNEYFEGTGKQAYHFGGDFKAIFDTVEDTNDTYFRMKAAPPEPTSFIGTVRTTQKLPIIETDFGGIRVRRDSIYKDSSCTTQREDNYIVETDLSFISGGVANYGASYNSVIYVPQQCWYKHGGTITELSAGGYYLFNSATGALEAHDGLGTLLSWRAIQLIKTDALSLGEQFKNTIDTGAITTGSERTVTVNFDL